MDFLVIFVSLSITVNHSSIESVFFEWVVYAHWDSAEAAVGRCSTENVLLRHIKITLTKRRGVYLYLLVLKLSDFHVCYLIKNMLTQQIMKR